MEEQNDQLKVEVIEIYEDSPKKYFLRGRADVLIILQKLKIEFREIQWRIQKNSTKIIVVPPVAYINLKPEDKKVKRWRRIIKFDPENTHQIISEAIQKEVRELYKDELEEHQKTIAKAKQAAAKEKEPVSES